MRFFIIVTYNYNDLSKPNKFHVLLYPSQLNDLTGILKPHPVNISVEPAGINVDLSLLTSQGIIDEIESGRYTISLTAYNANNDKTTNDFELVVRDIEPAPFLEKILRISGDSHLVVGFANGAATISLNGNSTTVTDGLFELTTNIRSDTIEYEIVDEFGNTYRGTIEYSDYTSQGAFG